MSPFIDIWLLTYRRYVAVQNIFREGIVYRSSIGSISGIKV